MVAIAALVTMAATAAWWLILGRPVAYGQLGNSRTLLDSSGAGVRIEVVELATTSGRLVTCLVRSPEAGSGERGSSRRRALLVAGGRRTGKRAALSVREADSIVVMSCDYPWAELARKRGASFAFWLPRIRAEVLGTPLLLGVAADYLMTRDDVDTSRMAGVGASLGVPPLAAWAARDPRAKAVALLYGGADLGAILEANLEEDVPWRPLRGPVGRLLGFLLKPLEPSGTVGRIAPRPVLVLGAEGDQWIPRSSVELLFAAAGEPRRLVWIGGEHVRTTNEALLAELGDTTSAWLSRVLR